MKKPSLINRLLNRTIQVAVSVVLLIGLIPGFGASAALTDATPLQKGELPVIEAGTEVSGTLTGNTTWRIENSPYIVTQSVLIDTGATLTIEPGVTIKFNTLLGMRVDGTLIARGTTGEPITFTSNKAVPAPGDWVNIRFSDSCIDAVYDIEGNYLSGSVLQYCAVQYGGGGEQSALTILDSSPLIDNCDISYHAAGGFNIDGGSPKITGNHIHDNTSSSAQYSAGGITIKNGTVTVTNNAIENNQSFGVFGGGGISIQNGTITISKNIIDNNQCTGDRGSGGISIQGGTVTISSNTIEQNQNLGLLYGAGGILVGSGTVIISKNVINNNTATGGAGGIYYMGSAPTIDDNLIRDNTGSFAGGIYANTGTITNNRIIGNSATYRGGGINASGVIVISYNDIHDNTAPFGGGLYLENLNKPLEYNTIVNNSQDGIYVTGSQSINSNNILSNSPYNLNNGRSVDTSDFNATGNWWGTDNETTIQAGIYDWNSNASLGRIVFKPFASTWIPDTPPVEYTLDITSTDGGSVTAPGEGYFTGDIGEVIDLVAEADAGFTFTGWAGDTQSISDPNASTTSITMNGHYRIIAQFTPLAPVYPQVSRDLPAVAGKGETIHVTVTFTATHDMFNAIGLTDFAPPEWPVQIDTSSCTPEVMESSLTGNSPEYIWDGPYALGQSFTAAYRVTVPIDAVPGVYQFGIGTAETPSGQLEFFVGQSGPFVAHVTGDFQIAVVEGAKVRGEIRDVIGTLLPGISVGIPDNVNTIGTIDGTYELTILSPGVYTVIAGSYDYRDEERLITITDLIEIYPLDFINDYGLVPNAPDLSYVLTCINRWKFPPQGGTGPGMSKVLEVINAWKFPIIHGTVTPPIIPDY